MAEEFTGRLEWITTGGSLYVRHPDGRSVKTAPVYGAMYARACEFGKFALVDVFVRDFVHGAGRFDPRVVGVRREEAASVSA